VRALVTMVTFLVGTDTFRMIGGPRFDSARVAGLPRDSAIAAHVRATSVAAPEGAIAVTRLPLVDELATQVDTTQLLLVPDVSGVAELRAGITRWLLVTLGGAVVVAILAAMLLSQFVAAPIEDLAARTDQLDLSRLDLKFATGRDDELG